MTIRAIVTAALLAAAPATAHAAYSSLVVFGDSLWDTRNAQLGALALGFPDPTPAAIGFFNGRFSNGPVAVDYLNDALVGGPAQPIAPLLFTPPLPPGIPFGTNYAVGGARAATNADPSTDFAGQLGFFNVINSGVADPNALYFVGFGSNDISANIQGTADRPSLAVSIASIVGGMQALNAAGARDFLVVGVADIGLEPRFLPQGVLGNALSVAFDAALRAALDAAFFSPGTDIKYFDSLEFFDKVRADPTAYGLPADIDLVTPCFTNPAALPNCDGYAFADDIHPSSSVHRAYGLALFQTVPTPATLALLGIGVIALAAARGRRR